MTHRHARLALVPLAVLLLAATATAASIADQATTSTSPYRDSRVKLRSDVRATSLVQGAELTYNPYVALNTEMRLSWWFTEHLYAVGTIDITRELTEADANTARGEWEAGDGVINAGHDLLWTDPWLGLEFAAEAELVLPTSKVAWAQTLVAETAANLSVSRSFDVWEGIIVGYTLRPGKAWHRYTTAENAGSSVGDCANSAGGCGRFVNSGERNASWSLTNDLVVQVAPTEWLKLIGRVGTVTGFLYPRAEVPGISYRVADPVDARFLNYYQLGARFNPIKALGITVGTSTTNPQLAPDGGYYMPFFNRYTRLFVDLRLDLAESVKLARQIEL
ncbi:MAG: hypothetical protein ABIJ09_05120 [Pseudomonadota bacterium]